MKILNKIFHDNIAYRKYTTKITVDNMPMEREYVTDKKRIILTLENRPNTIELVGDENTIFVLKTNYFYIGVLVALICATIVLLYLIFSRQSSVYSTIAVIMQVGLVWLSTRMAAKNRDIVIEKC